jgi:hypothetical protein
LDLLPYNRLAGAKYKATGIVFHPKFDEAAELNIPSRIFDDLGHYSQVKHINNLSR